MLYMNTCTCSIPRLSAAARRIQKYYFSSLCIQLGSAKIRATYFILGCGKTTIAIIGSYCYNANIWRRKVYICSCKAVFAPTMEQFPATTSLSRLQEMGGSLAAAKSTSWRQNCLLANICSCKRSDLRPTDHRSLLQPTYHRLLLQHICHRSLLHPTYHRSLLQPTYHRSLLHPTYHRSLLQPSYRRSLLQPIYHRSLLQPICQSSLLQPTYHRSLLQPT